MSDLKPLGSEKLNADEKLKRILELTYYKENKNKVTSKAELVRESSNGGVYGIVKEKDGYYVKRGLNESSLDYIGGIFMKNKNKFSSYAEALKRLELIKGQEELQEATKYVLKQNKPQQEAPAPSPAMDTPPPPPPVDAATDDMGKPSPEGMSSADMPEPDMSKSELPSDEMGGGEAKRSDYMAEVQKFAGKLGQELRDQKERMESDDIKYVLNMIISAVDLDKLDLEDLEEISKKFEREEEMGNEEGVPAEEPSPEDVPAEEPAPEEELGEYDSIKSLEELINTPIETDEINLSQYADLGNVKNESDDELKELDLDEIKNDINQAISERLSKYFS